ncbi:MAG: ATP synthase F1 subunit delta [Bryobacteraceae bacterium]
MTSTLVAKRYARALVDALVKPSARVTPPPQAEIIVDELHDFESMLEQSPDLRMVLATPGIPASRKRAVIERIAGSVAMSRLVRNFLLVLINHRRMGSLSAIIEAFEQMMDEHLGIVQVEVTSAKTLTEEQQKHLAEGLALATGKRVWLDVQVDQSLIGGVIARMGSLLLDASVRGRLDVLERRLRQV